VVVELLVRVAPRDAPPLVLMPETVVPWLELTEVPVATDATDVRGVLPLAWLAWTVVEVAPRRPLLANAAWVARAELSLSIAPSSTPAEPESLQPVLRVRRCPSRTTAHAET